MQSPTTSLYKPTRLSAGSQGVTTCRVDTTSSLMSDGSDLSTFPQKISSGKSQTGEQWLQHSSPSYQWVLRASSTWWERSVTEMRLSHSLCILIAYSHPPFFLILPEMFPRWVHVDIFSAFSKKVVQVGLRRDLAKSGSSPKPCFPSFLFALGCLSAIRDTQPEPEAGHGSPRAAERWYLCISENFPGFGCYKPKMGQCTAKLKEKIRPIVCKKSEFSWSSCSKCPFESWKALKVHCLLWVFPAHFFSLLTQGANCFFSSRGHSWRSDLPDLSVLRSSDRTFPLSLSSVSSHSCVFMCLSGGQRAPGGVLGSTDVLCSRCGNETQIMRASKKGHLLFPNPGRALVFTQRSLPARVELSTGSAISTAPHVNQHRQGKEPGRGLCCTVRSSSTSFSTGSENCLG